MSVFKTELLDPYSSTKQRSIYSLPEGVNVNSKKIRLLNFKLKKTLKADGSAKEHLFGLGGAVECISKISVLSRDGVEIDRINGEALRIMGMKNLAVPNASQYSIAKTLNQHADVSVITPTFASVENANPMGVANYWDVNNHSLTISISSMLQYLGVSRSVVAEGLSIMVEWALEQMEGAEPLYAFNFDNYPQIAYDVYLSNDVKPDAQASYMFYTMVQDTFPIKAGVANSIDKRFTAYVKQYIANFYYMLKDTTARAGDLALTNPRTSQFTEAPTKEELQLTLDGKTLYSRKGIVGSAMKQQFLNDYFSETNTPAGSNNELVKPMLLSTDSRISFGVAPLNRFIATELQLSYKDFKVHTKATQLITIAEILRVYNPATKSVMFVNQPSAPTPVLKL